MPGVARVKVDRGEHVPSSQISLLKSARIQGCGLWNCLERTHYKDGSVICTGFP